MKRQDNAKIKSDNKDLNVIYSVVSSLFYNKSYVGLKIIAIVSKICKFVSTFVSTKAI